jgi:hypothetical protein
VVLDAGRMLEVGSHDELMRAGGTYAELFELQARAYRDGSDGSQGHGGRQPRRSNGRQQPGERTDQDRRGDAA